MFKFLFGKKPEEAVVVETQRETLERLIKELNDALDALPEKPVVTVSPETGQIGLVLPEHLPDEALSLPAPESEKAAPEEPVAPENTEKMEDAAPEEAPKPEKDDKAA